jgi:hypothetical protein
MKLGRIEPDLPWTEFVVVRMLRRWAASRQLEANALPEMIALSRELGQPAQVAIALHSMFQLTEASLGRPLEAECCCSRALSRDEKAILTLIAAAPDAPPPLATAAVPHGLPGALHWAVLSVRAAMGITSPPEPVAAARCPFGPA